MTRRDKIKILTDIQAGKASVNDLCPPKLIIENPDGTLTCNGQTVTYEIIRDNMAKNIKYDISGVSIETLRNWIKLGKQYDQKTEN